MLNKIFSVIKFLFLSIDKVYSNTSKERQDDIRDFVNKTWNV